VRASYSAVKSLLGRPIYLALTDAGFVLVLDADNKRVIMLDPDLYHVRNVVTSERGGCVLTDPCRICWDDVNSRLYVAESSGEVLVFELVPC